jgi:hypothetical protein
MEYRDYVQRIARLHIPPATYMCAESEWCMPQRAMPQPSLMTHLIERLDSVERDRCQMHELSLNAFDKNEGREIKNNPKGRKKICLQN